MVKVTGKGAVKAYFAKAPEKLNNILRGAARAAANVVADEAKDRSISAEVSAAIRVRTKLEPGRIVARVEVAGKGAYIAPWLEYGTDPHFISVADDKRAGMSIGRINSKVRDGSLVISGKFVGDTVWHPGARPHPFLRPALDIKEAEAIRMAQHHISTRIVKAGIVGRDEGDEA